MTCAFLKVKFSYASPSTRHLEELGASKEGKETISCSVVFLHQRAWVWRERKLRALLPPLLRQLGSLALTGLIGWDGDPHPDELVPGIAVQEEDEGKGHCCRCGPSLR